MYLGLLVVLVAWAVYLSRPLALLVVPVYVLYITRFQIVPEERVLGSLFGTAYSTYRERVGRWL
jgi:protein-S-isoprenylcysteine O-methyltransferase Ste14